MKNKTPPQQSCELISFYARVVGVEAYKSVVDGKVLYHAVLDSLKNEPQRQAQFFGLEEDVFKAGDLHVVSFSRPIAGASKRAVKIEMSRKIMEMAAVNSEAKPN